MENLKLKKIGVKNHVQLNNFECVFGDGTTEIWGLNETGKSSIIDALLILIRGMGKKSGGLIGDRYKVIGPASKSMGIEATLIDTRRDNAEIVLSRKISGSGNGKIDIKAPKGYPTLTADWLRDLLHSAFLSPKYFCALTSQEQALSLGIDTAKFDAKLKALKLEYTGLGRDLKPYDALEEIERVESVDVENLGIEKENLKDSEKKRIEKIRNANQKLTDDYYKELEEKKEEAREFNREQNKRIQKIQKCLEVELDLEKLKYPDMESIEKWIKNLPPAEKPINTDEITIPLPEYADDSPDNSAIDAIDERIKAAYETNNAARIYRQYLDKVSEGDKIRAARTKNQADQRQIIADKNAYVAAQNLPFTGLSIGENGELLLDGKEIREPYFSKGKLIKTVASLKAKCGDSLKVVFLDDVELLDEDNRGKIVSWLIGQGFQVIMACVGRSKPAENKIVLSPIEDQTDKEGMV